MYKDDINKYVWGFIVFGISLIFILPNPGGFAAFLTLISFILLCVKIFQFIYEDQNETGPLKEGWKEFNVVDRVIWLEKAVEGYLEDRGGGFVVRHDPKPFHKTELDYLKKKYKKELANIESVKTKRIKRAESEKKVSAKVHKEREYDLLYGKRNKHLVCPHCQSKGNVFKRKKDNIEESREKGIIGATIGRKTITKKGSYDQLHCDKCGTTWAA